MKSLTFFKIFTGVVLVLALFATNLDQRILLVVILIGLLGTLFLAVLPRIHFPQWERTPIRIPKKKKHLPAMDEDDPLATALICQIGHRITEKLRSAYPQATWNWEKTPSIKRILSGQTIRIQLMQAGDYTHAEINLDSYGSIQLHLLIIKDLTGSSVPEDDGKETDPPTDCASWYELIGKNVLQQVITDLNARGYSSLSINENGDVFIMEKDTPVIKERFDNFPGRKYWKELTKIMEENELKVKNQGSTLVLSWRN